MNSVIMMGRLCQSPEVRYSNGANATAIAKFSIAVDRKYKREGDTNADFFNVVAFGNLGEFVEKYLDKGTKIVISGRLENNNYIDKNGNKVYNNQIIAEEIEFAESKQKNSSESQSKPDEKNNGFMNIPDGIDEQLPFN